VPTNPTDQNHKDSQAPAAVNSAEKPSFLSDWHSIPDDNVQSAENWVTLCAPAAVEPDPRKLLELVSEINRLLDNRRKRLLNKTA